MSAFQLPLGIKLDDGSTFENFVVGSNRDVLNVLQQNQEPMVFIWGSPGTGKSHLLQAISHVLPQHAQAVFYVPMSLHDQFSIDMLEDLEHYDVVSIDDIQCIAGQREWEVAIFDLINRLREQGKKLRVAGRASPKSIEFVLPDLVSRLTWGPVFQLQVLSDDDKISALQIRARQRGMQLSDEAATYILKNYPRDMHSLFDVLNKLDSASLQHQRLLTIPFIKQISDA